MFRKVTIVGIGLIGGSVAMAIKKHRLAGEVVGLSQRQESLDQAVLNKVIDAGLTDVKAALLNADLVVLAVPVDSIIKLFPTINPYLKRGCLVTDVGSAKAKIVAAAQTTLNAPGFFVGSHPLAGSEKSGASHACAELFENSLCIMTPTEKTNTVAKEKIKHFWTKLGAQVKFLPAEEHDAILSYISHLPHLLAYGLIATIPQEYLPYATQGLKDTTRIAASSPQMWNGICMANSQKIIKSLDEFVRQLSYFRKAMIQHDQKNLIHHFTKAKEKRDGF